MALNADTLARTLADLDRRLRGVERSSQSARTSVETPAGETLVLADAAARGVAAADVAAAAEATADAAQAAADAAAADVAAAVADIDNAVTTANAAASGVSDLTTLTDGWKATDGVSIDGGALYADSIGAGVIATDAILARHVKAGELTAAHLTAGTITAASGVIGSLDASKITVGTLDTARIAAGSIATSKLLVGDPSNMAEIDNVNADPVPWGGWTTALSGGWITRSGTRDQYFMFRRKKGPVPFKTGDVVRFTFDAYASATVSASPALWQYNAAGAGISTTNLGTALSITTTPQTFSATVTIGADTTGAASYLVGLNGAGLTTTDVFVRNVRVFRMGAGELIVDGSITAAKLSATAIDGKTITGATIRTAASGQRWTLDSAVVNMILGYTGAAGESQPGSLAMSTDGTSGMTNMYSPQFKGGAAALSLSSPRPGYEADGAEAFLGANGAATLRVSERWGVQLTGPDLTYDSRALPLGLIALNEQTADSSGATSTTQVWSGISLTFDAVKNRRYKISVLGAIKSTVAGDRGSVIVRDDPGGAATPSYVMISQTVPMPAANSSIGVNNSVVVSYPTNKTVDLFVYLQRVSGTGTVRLAGAATTSQLVVEDIGRVLGEFSI